MPKRKDELEDSGDAKKQKCNDENEDKEEVENNVEGEEAEVVVEEQEKEENSEEKKEENEEESNKEEENKEEEEEINFDEFEAPEEWKGGDGGEMLLHENEGTDFRDWNMEDAYWQNLKTKELPEKLQIAVTYGKYPLMRAPNFTILDIKPENMYEVYSGIHKHLMENIELIGDGFFLVGFDEFIDGSGKHTWLTVYEA